MNLVLPQFDNQFILDLAERVRPYDVKYHLFRTNKATKYITLNYVENLKKKQSLSGEVCFSKIRYGIPKAYNALAYCLTDINLQQLHYLTAAEIKKWLKLCKKFKLIGEDVSIKFGAQHPYVIIKFDNYTKNQLYVYVSAIRYLVEWPTFVRTILTFYDVGLPFYSAFVAASRLTVDNTVHHIINVTRYYGERTRTHKDLYNCVLPLAVPIALKLFVSDFHKYDKTDVYEGKFTCMSAINEICSQIDSVKTEVTLKELFTGELKNLVNAETKKEMDCYLELYNTNKGKYKFIIPRDKKKESKKAKKGAANA